MGDDQNCEIVVLVICRLPAYMRSAGEDTTKYGHVLKDRIELALFHRQLRRTAVVEYRFNHHSCLGSSRCVCQ